jgi:hypothetical protein
MMTDEEIIEAGRLLSHSTIGFLCEAIRKHKYETLADRDGIILCAMIRVVISKIIHRCDSQKEADIVFTDFLNALVRSWDNYDFTETSKPLH